MFNLYASHLLTNAETSIQTINDGNVCVSIQIDQRYPSVFVIHSFICTFVHSHLFRTNNLYSDCIAIKDIRPNLKNINVVFIILEVGAATVTKENRVVRTFKVGDPTAVINVSVWDEPGNLLVPGDIVRLTKGYAAIWRHCLTLYSGKNGDIHKVGEFCMNFNEHVNMSEPNPSLTGPLPLQPLQQQQSIVVNPLAQKNPTSTVTAATSVIINNNGTASTNNANNTNNNNGNSIVMMPPAATVIAPVPIVVTATSNAIPSTVAQPPAATKASGSSRSSAAAAAAAAAATAVATTSEHSKTSTSKTTVRGARNSRR